LAHTTNGVFLSREFVAKGFYSSNIIRADDTLKQTSLISGIRVELKERFLKVGRLKHYATIIQSRMLCVKDKTEKLSRLPKWQPPCTDFFGGVK